MIYTMWSKVSLKRYWGQRSGEATEDVKEVRMFRRGLLCFPLILFVLLAVSIPSRSAASNHQTSIRSCADCARTTVGFTAINDLKTGKYKNYRGGLYPRGSDVPPSSHLNAGIKFANSIQPLDSNGNPDAKGRY